MNFLRLSFRSLIFRRKQYFALFLVCIFGISISIFGLFLVNGMLNALELKAKIYYGGDFQFEGGDNSDFGFAISEELFTEIEEIFPQNAVVSPRFTTGARNAAFYYEGVEVLQRAFKGVDFSREQELFSKFNYVEGSAKEMIQGGNVVLISESIAKMLGVSAEDQITIMTKNDDGYFNTAELVVKGIFRDSSLFGMYCTYFDINFLTKFSDFPSKFGNRIAIYFPDQKITKKDTEFYQAQLAKKINMFPIVDDEDIFADAISEAKIPFPTYALIPLNANLAELKILIDAMKIVTFLVIISLVAIIVVGIGGTYRVIVTKRINEIGIYKSLGMSRKQIFALLAIESLLLLGIACVLAQIFCAIFCALIGFFDFSFIPAFDIFLVGGKIKPLASVFGATFIFVSVLVTTECAVMFSVRGAVKKSVADALSVTE